MNAMHPAEAGRYSDACIRVLSTRSSPSIRVIAQGGRPGLDPGGGGFDSHGPDYFLVADPEEVEGPGCDPGAKGFESLRSPQLASRLTVKTLV